MRARCQKSEARIGRPSPRSRSPRRSCSSYAPGPMRLVVLVACGLALAIGATQSRHPAHEEALARWRAGKGVALMLHVQKTGGTFLCNLLRQVPDEAPNYVLNKDNCRDGAVHRVLDADVELKEVQRLALLRVPPRTNRTKFFALEPAWRCVRAARVRRRGGPHTRVSHAYAVRRPADTRRVRRQLLE